LVELGGRSNLNRVLDRVLNLMKGRLNEHDLTPLASDGVMPRCCNAAQQLGNRRHGAAAERAEVTVLAL
jgi:hypothetical protein